MCNGVISCNDDIHLIKSSTRCVCFRVPAEASSVSPDEPLRQIQMDAGTEGSDTQRTCEARSILGLYTCQVINLRPVRSGGHQHTFPCVCCVLYHSMWAEINHVEELNHSVFPAHDYFLILGRSYPCCFLYLWLLQCRTVLQSFHLHAETKTEQKCTEIYILCAICSGEF